MRRWGVLLVLAPAVLLLVALAAQLPADPVPGVTFSNSPFTDEGWNAMGARNWVLLGDPGAGNWVLYLVQLPFTAIEAASFGLFGVGIVQARLVVVACSVASVAGVGLVVRRTLGTVPAAVSAASLAGSALVLYYGHLVYMEDLVTASLVLGAGLLCVGGPGSHRLRALLGGAMLAVAIGAKPSAAFAAAGIIIGTWAAVRTWQTARQALLALGVVGAAAAGWVLGVALPRATQIGQVLDIWAKETLPGDLAELVARIRAFAVTDQLFALAWPLGVAGAAGALAVAITWRRLDRPQRRLAGAAIGWLVAGGAVLLVASYRPNRYIVPLLPALAILTGYLVQFGLTYARGRPQLRAGLWAAAAVVVAVLVVPGTLSYVSWAGQSSDRLPAIQQRFLASMDSEPIEGGVAATLAMRVPAPIYVSWSTSDLNAGDLYAGSGIRWLVSTADFTPAWSNAHAAAWEGRQTLFCVRWGSADRCLQHIP